MVGQKFVRLTVVSRSESDKHGNIMWNCVCDCGEVKRVSSSKLKSGHTKSCGCYNRDLRIAALTKHGMVGTPVYRSWAGMKNRCTNANDPHWPRYGGRGISVCERWLESFSNFYEDMGDSPFAGAEIDRIDNNGNYSPDNCRWATRAEQSRNRRSNIVLEYQGLKMCLAEWSRYTGIHYCVIKKRYLRGLTPDRILERYDGRKRQYKR